MPPLFKRERTDASGQQLLSPEFAPVEPLTPFEFVAANADALRSSAHEWSVVASRLNDTQGDERRELIRDNLRHVFSLTQSPATEESFEAEADRLTKAMGSFVLLVTRHMSGGEGIKDTYGRSNDKDIYAFKDTNLGHLLRNDRKNSYKLHFNVTRNSRHMRLADMAGKETLLNLAATYAGEPAGLLAFVSLYEDGAAELDPLFDELRQIITADWLHYDDSMSVLKNYCANLRNNPAYLVEPFIREVTSERRDRRMAVVATMARFAVSAMAGTGASLTDAQALRSTYDKWDQFEDIDSVFKDYAEGRVAQLERAFAGLAKPEATRSIRLHRSRDEIDNYKDNMYIHYGTGRNQRRAEVKARSRHGFDSTLQLPSRDEFQAQAALAERNDQPREILTVKQTNQGMTLVPLELEDIAKNFGIKQGNGLEKDVLAMVEYLRRTPLSQASVRLKSNRGRMPVQGARLNLWRFAPNDASDLTVNGDNRHQRVVFAIHERKLVLVDIVDHDTFDKRYR